MLTAFAWALFVVVCVGGFVYSWKVGRSLARQSLPRAAVLGFVLVAIVATSVGLSIDAQGFAANAAAEIAGLAVSVIVAVMVAESLIERRRREQWNRVAAWLTGDIEERLWGMLLIGDETILPRDYSSRLAAGKNLPAALDFMANRIRAHAEDWAASGTRSAERRGYHRPAGRERETKEELLEFASSRPLLRAVQEVIHPLRDTVTPRVLDLGTDARLVDLLLQLEYGERLWSQIAAGVRGVLDDDPALAWRAAAGCYGAARDLAAHVRR
jgi:hypothetical protein